MMMQMCAAAGLDVLTDHQRRADEDNLKGYFELERIKRLEKDASWLPQAKGKVVKIISTLLKRLPPECHYKIIFMQRNLSEIIQSQKRMLQHRGEPDRFSDGDLDRLYRNHLKKVTSWLHEQINMELLEVNYNDLLKHPLEAASKIHQFLESATDPEAMVQAVDSRLYRQKTIII